jgi:hypothetical protein
MMRFLLYSVLVCLGAGCTSAYRGRTKVAGQELCVERMKPSGVSSGWFTAGVDVMGRRMTGLLLVKNMEAGGTRVVMTSEAGVTFFDFEFTQELDFKVHRIIPQLDRKAVVNLLQQDFGLLLGIPFRDNSVEAHAMNSELYFGTTQKKETSYFITDMDCSTLLRLEIGSARKRKVSITFEGDAANPASAVIRHHTFDMVITLRKFEKP